MTEDQVMALLLERDILRGKVHALEEEAAGLRAEVEALEMELDTYTELDSDPPTFTPP